MIQEVYATGFEPGETISATVFSTPFALTPVVADVSGNATFTFPIDSSLELGAHRVELSGSVTGDLPLDREATAFTVTAVAATAPGSRPGLPSTGFDGLWLGGLGAVMLLLGGAFVATRRARME